MGIKGLHGLLKSIQKPCQLKKFSGKTLGVDAYGWLHRGTVACAVDLVLDRPTMKHIEFVLNRVRMLIYFGVAPYLVFDGDNLPSKSGTESGRHQKRQTSKALGIELLRKGRTAEAYQEFQKAVDVTPLMARRLIEELKKMDVKYVVAPYEADAQLVYLEMHGLIDGIISEDSDLLVFGAKRLLSKLDQYGDCIEINRSDFTACREVSLVGWSDADFRRMCILSGCDYLPNIARMGLKTAYRSIRKYKNVEKTLRMLQFDGQYHVPTDYLENFKQAELTFLYQRVFCPKEGKLVTLTPPDDEVKLEELTYIGGDVDPEIAVGVARGDLDPTTKEPIVLKALDATKVPDSKFANTVNRRQTIGSFAELKPNKPINSFFTPKRVPLAELDPNSLTPSPTQQRLLQRHANTSWEASPAPAGQFGVRSAPASRQSNHVSSPLVRSAERSSFLARASKLSTTQSAKRQRLCSEVDETSTAGTPGCHSRFFAPALDDCSPSGQKASRSKKVRKSTLDVFSDDIVEDIMSQLPDPSQTTTTKENSQKASEPSRSEYQQEEPRKIESSTVKNDTGPTKAATPSVLNDSLTPAVTASKSVSIDSNPQAFHQALDYHIKKQNSITLAKFTFCPDGSKISPKHEVNDNPGPQNGRVRSLKPATTTAPLQNKRLTPLQRLGQNALARSRSMDVISFSSPHFGLPENKCQHDSETGVRSGQGSEDLMVPDSEEEDEVEEVTPSRSRLASLDLKRFSFASK